MSCRTEMVLSPRARNRQRRTGTNGRPADLEPHENLARHRAPAVSGHPMVNARADAGPPPEQAVAHSAHDPPPRHAVRPARKSSPDPRGHSPDARATADPPGTLTVGLRRTGAPASTGVLRSPGAYV